MNEKNQITMDGNTAAAYASYAFTEVSAIYPITPSSVMADVTEKYVASGKKNIFDSVPEIRSMQSEAGVAGAIHGALTAGALATTYTSSQGLLLMVPNMYKMAGELLPGVIHVAARTLATHALSIMGDHSDIYACRQTGYAMLCANNPQEVMHLAAVAHLSSIKSSVPFLHFFDGFRTSHEIQKIKILDYEDLNKMLDKKALGKFKSRALNPCAPIMRGTAQGDDVYFQAREASNKFYQNVPQNVEHYMNEINKITGSNYELFNYYGHKDAENIIIAMGSVCETIEETVDYLNSQGQKTGLIKVRLYRPFSSEHLLKVMPQSVKKISVLDRTKEPGALGEPLYLDITTALTENKIKNIEIYSGRFGLSSKDTTPGQILSVFGNMKSSNPKKKFTIGINDDVTGLSLTEVTGVNTAPAENFECTFWGLGSDGTVGATKNTVKIIGNHTDMYVQGYFSYDSKKSGGLTISHLRFGKKPIKSTYYVNKSDFTACHNPAYVFKYDIVSTLKKGGKFLLNCSWDEKQINKILPDKIKRFLAENNIDFYTVDGFAIAKRLGLGGKINSILQASFFKIASVIDIKNASLWMKEAVKNTYGHKGQNVVQMNLDAIDAGMQSIKKINVPKDWIDLKDSQISLMPTSFANEKLGNYVKNILYPVESRHGNSLPVSAFLPYVDGGIPLGSSAFEKRGISQILPQWKPENCIECNLCSLVCPHAVIRPGVLTDEELQNAPGDPQFKKMTGLPDFNFCISVSTKDCTGCGNCAEVCPGTKGNKALTMANADQNDCLTQKFFDYSSSLPVKQEVLQRFKPSTIKGSQFKTPLLEFSGACAGCGETPYAKLATQLFGDKMYIANATGCSSIWGASFPSSPYTVNENGEGPCWHNSLFEDNAEFGYGMLLAQNAMRKKLFSLVQNLKNNSSDDNLKQACQEYILTFEDSETNKIASENLVKILETDNLEACKYIIENKRFLNKKSVWVFGGDGWAYDIGFGGLDHVIASNEDINILVFDTEVYSNTGGQVSKSTQMGAVAQFACKGKKTPKKDLAAIAMAYKHVYVAHVAMGANYNQCLKAFTEAEKHKGPSLIIAYSPCINHGIKQGMRYSHEESKLAVKSGYWKIFRFNPDLALEGKEPFTDDSRTPSMDINEFLKREIRFNLINSNKSEVGNTATQKEKYDILSNNAKTAWQAKL